MEFPVQYLVQNLVNYELNNRKEHAGTVAERVLSFIVLGA